MVDTENVDVQPEDFTASNAFREESRHGDLSGIFQGEVIRECFDGEARNLKDGKEDTVLLVGEIHGCKFGLVTDLDSRVVITGWVLSCDSVEAYQSGLWSAETIQKMGSIQHDHWAEEGNKQVWKGSDKEQKSHYDGEFEKFS